MHLSPSTDDFKQSEIIGISLLCEEKEKEFQILITGPLKKLNSAFLICFNVNYGFYIYAFPYLHFPY